MGQGPPAGMARNPSRTGGKSTCSPRIYPDVAATYGIVERDGHGKQDRPIGEAFATMTSDATWTLSNLEAVDVASDLPRPVQHGIDPRIEDVTNPSDSFPTTIRRCLAKRSLAKQYEAWRIEHTGIADYKSFILAANLSADLEVHAQNAHRRLFSRYA
jgi:hypothetical protein